MFLRRLGPDPHASGAQTVALNNCPDMFELETAISRDRHRSNGESQGETAAHSRLQQKLKPFQDKKFVTFVERTRLMK